LYYIGAAIWNSLFAIALYSTGTSSSYRMGPLQLTIKKKQTGCRKNDRRAAKEKKYMEFGSMSVIIDVYLKKLLCVCE
jgi:hypothetical protein